MGIITILLLLFYVGTNNSQLSTKTPEPARGHQVESVYTNRPEPTPVPTKSRGVASWYDRKVCQGRVYGVNCKTANGEIFDENKPLIACAKRFYLGDHVRLCYMDKCIDTICGDRGNFEKYGRTFDLPVGVFNSLADPNKGVINIVWEKLN